MKKDSWLKTAEYAALAGSALGTVAAAISSQVTYATAPLTLALSLNLINRTRLEKQARQRSTIESAQVHQLVESLHNQVTALPSQAVDLNPIYQAISQLNNNTQSLVQHYNARPEIEQIQELKEALASYPLELNELQSNIQKLAQQFNSRSEIEQIQELKEAIAALPHPLELNDLQQEIATQVDESIRNFAEQIRAQLALIEPYDYDLVFDRPESRATLMQALKQAQHRLILVCPWIGYGTDERVIPKLEKLLQRNVHVDIGWGFFDHINSLNNSPGQIRQQLKSYSKLYSNLPQLEALEQKYPQQFKLKLLGTHEKFLVCDSEWAMLGSHNFLTFGAFNSERALGLKTNDPRIVAKLIERFESAKDLERG